MADQLWQTSSGTAKDRFKYAYDSDGNRLYKEVALGDTVSGSHSELYHADGADAGYDALGRLTTFQRGTLSDADSDGVKDTVSTCTREQSWTLDPLGNWSTLNSDGTSLRSGRGSPRPLRGGS